MRNSNRILAACVLIFLTLGFFWISNVPWVIASNIQVGFPVLARTGNTTTYATSTGALTPADCVSIDANGNFIDSGVAGCGGSGSGKGGIVVYSAASLTLSGTQYVPIGGGGLPSSTETNVDTSAPSAATVTNFDVQMSSAPGIGNNVAFTWRQNGASTALTCTITGNVSTSCNDSTHSFTVAQGDLLTIQLVSTGVIAGTPNLVLSTQFGTTGSNGTVNTATAHQTAVYSAAGTAVSGVGPGSSGQVLTSNGAGSDPTFQNTLHVINFVIDGGGSVIATGDSKVYPSANYTCTINKAMISADQSGSITVDVWKANAAIPTSGNKISASAPVTLSTSQLNQASSLTGWTLTVAPNDVFGFSVATATTVTRVVGELWCQ